MPGKQTSGAEIILFPDFAKLKAEVERLCTELSMLVYEHDELLYVECKNIEMMYMLKLGNLEYQVYKMECTVLRLKRKMELVQARLNRREKVVLSEIEAQLDAEFEEYRKKLNELLAKMDEALERSTREPLSKEEETELKKLYRKIVKALHPDVNPGIGEEKIRLFQRAVEAYQTGNLEHLRIIAAMIEDPALPGEKADAYKLLKEEKERLIRLIQDMKDKIGRIKSDFPYNMKPLLQDPEKLKARKAELNAMLEHLKALHRHYAERIRQMLG